MKSEIGEAVAKGAGQKGEMPDKPGKPDGEKRGREMSSPKTSSGFKMKLTVVFVQDVVDVAEEAVKPVEEAPLQRTGSPFNN